MKLKYQILSFISLFVCCFSVTANQVEEFRKSIQALNYFSADFVQQVKDEHGKAIQEGRGHIKLAQPNRVRWQQTSPDELEIVTNGQSTWVFDSYAEQVTVYNTEQIINSTPFVLLTNQDSKLWEQYTITKQQQRFVIVPKNSESAHVKRLEVGFSKRSLGLASLVVEDASGQVSQFDFENPVINKKFDSSVFEFTSPEGVDIDDQRNNG